jgi:hypothetical protein
MSTNTSIGPDYDKGGNENHGNADGCGNKTLGDQAVPYEPPAGAEAILGEDGAELPAASPGAGKPPNGR